MLHSGNYVEVNQREKLEKGTQGSWHIIGNSTEAKDKPTTQLGVRGPTGSGATGAHAPARVEEPPPAARGTHCSTGSFFLRAPALGLQAAAGRGRWQVPCAGQSSALGN